MRSFLAIGFGLILSASPVLGAEEVTFAKHVAPILWKNCAGCHRPGEVGPFSLLTYKDAAKRADFIRDVTAKRQMPPWKPEAGFAEFRDARRLSDSELKTLATWAETGAKEGDPKDLPPAPKFAEGWQLGDPDLILKMPEPFTVHAEGRDIHRCFVIPIPIEKDQDVTALEFRPGNRRVVHHAIFFLDHSGAARMKDRKDGKAGYGTFGGPGIIPTGGLGAWAPGVMPRFLPEGVAKYLKKGSDLVLQIHYHPDGKEEVDESMVGLYFAKKPVTHYVAGYATANQRLYLEAGKKDQVIKAQSDPLPTDVNAMAISPHMHLLGKQIKVEGVTPDGKSVPLIWIKDWDFNWQGTYQFAKPVPLPKGTVIKFEAIYDNSAENPRNPSTPPKSVRWGEQTTDEMCLVSVQVTAANLAELRKVTATRAGRLGMAIDGSAPMEVSAQGIAAATKVVVPPGGFPILERAKDLLTPYDKNKDGKLSVEEIEAMPAPLRERVMDAIRDRLSPGGQ